ncbi:hypothetical protein GRI38_04250 [Altererythrobacter aurantiacus]|uniref:Uncharacterized protein n=1 Tax=Parapontixanthobacter aurantiacus TaxID=1463599 RepID=A0A844ZCG8_9SPHN|nr:hypothetical protein [Parapontixanthobacter aurantiacus]MXO85234.1 hypothetical protein [Parapontixanthobacter aurantiacus]
MSNLDPDQPPDGIAARDWSQMVEDACWLYEAHARYAVRNGWKASGLFGVRLDYPPGGGLAQVLRGSRSLAFDGPIAHVRQFGVRMTRNPACGHGLPIIWELTDEGRLKLSSSNEFD